MPERLDVTRSDQLLIEFHGPAVDDGRIEVSSFAPSLLAVQIIMGAAAQELYGPRTLARVKVAGTNQGSFGGLLEIMVTFLASDPAVAANALIGLLLGAREGTRAVSGLIGLAKARTSKDEVPSASTTPENGVVRIELGGETYETTEAALRLFRRRDIRDALDALFAIRSGATGIHRFTITSRQRQEAVDREDLAVQLGLPSAHVAYMMAASEVKPHEVRDLGIVEAEYEIVAVAFRPGSNWRLRNEDRAISARMDDLDFIDRMERRAVSSSQGDRIVCLVRTIERPWGGSTRKIRAIEKVISHIPLSDVDT